MPRKRKKPKFSAAKAIKAKARELIGAPPPVQRIPALKDSRKTDKHKLTLGELLRPDE